MAVATAATRSTPYRGGVTSLRTSPDHGEDQTTSLHHTSRGDQHIRRLQRAARNDHHHHHTASNSHNSSRSLKKVSTTVGRNINNNARTWNKAAAWQHGSASGDNNSAANSEAPTFSHRQSLPHIRLKTDAPAVAHSGAVGAYIRKTLANRRSKSMPAERSTAGATTPPPSGESDDGAGWAPAGGRTGPQQQTELLPTFHKSPNAAAAVPKSERLALQVGAGHQWRKGPPAGGEGVDQERSGSQQLYMHRSVVAGHFKHQSPGAGGGGLHYSSSLPLQASATNPGLTPHADGLSGFNRGGGGGPQVEAGGLLPHPDGNNPGLYAVPNSYNQLTTVTSSSTTTFSAPTSSPTFFRQHPPPAAKSLPWNKYNQQLLRNGGIEPPRPSRLSPLLSSSSKRGTGGTLAHRMAAARGGVGVASAGSGATDANGFPMIEFRSYQREPGSTQHRTFTFNIPEEPTGPPGFPSSVSSISPNSVTESIVASPPKNESNLRSRKGSVSNELAPGFKQLLRTSTPKRERESHENVKRRKVEFKVDSPDILNVERKDPVTAISEKLELNRSLKSESDDETHSKKPPKSILKKRDKNDKTGEARYARKYQVLAAQQSTLKLPSITDSQNSLTGRNTRANTNRTTLFSCSKEFAAAFEGISDGEL